MISNTDQERIQKEVILGIIPQKDDTAEEHKFRASIIRDYIEATKREIMLDIPCDWDAEQREKK